MKFKSLEARDKFTEDSRNIAFKVSGCRTTISPKFDSLRLFIQTQNGAMFADAVVYDFEDGVWGY